MRKTLLLIALAGLACLPAVAQKPIPGPYCNLLSVAGQSRANKFMAFDDELRQALAKQDISALTLLVHFPFRVNTNYGAYSIQDAGEFRAEFQKLFPQKVRNQIIHQDPSTIFCNIEGIRLGHSQIWGLLVNHWQFGYAIDTINLDLPPPSANAYRIDFVCRTPKFRIIIDSKKEGDYRYRAWNAGRSVADSPSLTIQHGNESMEGSDLCAYATWTFKYGSTTYAVSGMGCDADLAPQGARGELDIDVNGKKLPTKWCY